jgi:hypothetical protein
LGHRKGSGHGEIYRHNALTASSALYVAHICDDDLWMPSHLAEMNVLLCTADFGNLLHVFVRPDGTIDVLADDLGRAETRRRMCTETFNIFSPTYAGYRMEAYRRLPEGWTPAPPGIWSDLHMWRKFLAIEDFTFATRMAITALHFATFERLDVTLDQRERENRRYFDRIRDRRHLEEMVHAAWRSLIDRIARDEVQIAAVAASRSALEVERDKLQAAHNAMTAEVSRTMAAHDAALTENAALAKSLATVQADLDHMIASKCWRLTAPLRAITAKMGW